MQWKGKKCQESNSGRFRGWIINNNTKGGNFWPEFFGRWRQVAL